jgi:bla regulator protein BlaR1
MPESFTFLIKVNIALMLFCMGYYLVLRKLTFYTLNRAYLIVAIIFSSVYPFINLSVFAQQHQEIVAPVQNVVIIWQAPAENFVRQATYWNWLEIAFWTGVAVFAARLLFQMVSLYRIYAKSTAKEINGQNVRVVNADISPFSFWQSIYINPEKLNAGDLDNIIAHEQVHVKEWHTLDVLLTEISVIFYWFNPGIWMMKRAVRENIEFITDRKILQKGLDSKAYQYSLLNITFNNSAPAITSNFNFSTLKKRIMMMNAKRSSNLNLTRYAFLMPVVVICLFIFSLSKTETVKASPAFKAVAAAMERINNVITLNADTTPVTKTTTTTVTVKNDKAAGTKSAVTITNFDSKARPEVLISTLTDTGKKSTAINIRSGNITDSVVIVVDGKIYQKPINNMDPNTIETVSVIKNASSDILNKIEGLNTSADNKAKGVILITTKDYINATSTAKTNLNEVTVVGYGVNKKEGYKNPDLPYAYDFSNRPPIVANTPVPYNREKFLEELKEKLVIVDGKIIPSNEIEKINQGEIVEFSILTGKTATSLYGEKAKNGALIIVTKGNK